MSLGQRWLWMVFAFCLAFAFAGEPAWAKLDSSASSQKRYALAKKEYQNLLYSKSKMKYRNNWMQAIAGFQSILKKYPKTQESYKSVFTLGRLYQKLGKRTGGALRRLMRWMRTGIPVAKIPARNAPSRNVTGSPSKPGGGAGTRPAHGQRARKFPPGRTRRGLH